MILEGDADENCSSCGLPTEPAGPPLVVNLETQGPSLPNGVPIGATPVLVGRQGYETPTGVFTILQKKKEHYSGPTAMLHAHMQRLTWRERCRQLPGYPASHGCIGFRNPFQPAVRATELG